MGEDHESEFGGEEGERVEGLCCHVAMLIVETRQGKFRSVRR